MEYRSTSQQLQAFLKATLLGLVLLSMATLAPRVCSCLRAFLFVTIPSAASAIATPKCLFVFSNIIVVFLATESKLLRTGADDHQSQSSSEEIIDAVGGGGGHQQLAALVHVMKENYTDQKMVKLAAEQEALHQVVRYEQKDDDVASSSSMVFEEERDDVLLVDHAGGDACDVMELVEEEVIERGEEEMWLPTDELNKKVEDFIARFNRERQLEARIDARVLLLTDRVRT